MTGTFKQNLVEYINAFTLYDYLAYGWLFFVFFIILILAIALAKKKPIMALVLTLFSFVTILAGPIFLKYFLDQTVRKNEITINRQTKLHFANTLIITGTLKNISKVNFQKCKLKASIIKYSANAYRNKLNSLKPIRKKSILLTEKIPINETVDFKIVFDDFDYQKDFNVSVNAECY